MQIEIYKMTADNDSLTITLEAICDSFSSLIWDIEYYRCGQFEVYIAASPRNIEIFQTGRIVGRDDDSQHFGIIESVQIDTDIENGDYITVRGRFLMCLLERRIIYPTLSFTSQTSYADIVRTAVTQNAIDAAERKIPGLSIGAVTGNCWEQTATLQVSYDNLMEWIYTICEKIGGTANIRLVKSVDEKYLMVFELLEGIDRSMMQEVQPHIIFSDAYSNLLSFSYAEDASIQRNFAYILGQGEGAERKQTTYMYDYDITENTSPFYENDAVKKLVVSDGITSIGETAFKRCMNLENVSLPATLTKIGSTAFMPADGSFSSAGKLSNIEIPQNVIEIGGSAFWGSAITSVKIPQNVATVGRYVFRDCQELRTARYEGTVIGGYMFVGCSNLREFTIAHTVKEIGENCFNYCTRLETIVYEGSMDDWKAVKKGDNWAAKNVMDIAVSGVKNIQCLDGYFEWNNENKEWTEVKV